MATLNNWTNAKYKYINSSGYKMDKNIGKYIFLYNSLIDKTISFIFIILKDLEPNVQMFDSEVI